MPDAVDDDAGGEGVIGRGDPFGQLAPAAGAGGEDQFLAVGKDFGDTAGDLFGFVVDAATDEKGAVGDGEETAVGALAGIRAAPSRGATVGG